MKRRVFGVILSLLLILTACGGGSDAPYTFQPEASNDQIVTVVPPVDLPVQESDNVNQNKIEVDISPEEVNQNTPEGNEAPGNENQAEENVNPSGGKGDNGNKTVDEDGWYTSKEEVALYIHLYDRLPDNYVTKKEAEEAGWKGGNVERYTGEGTAIGGSSFGNREGLLPKEKGRVYTECDIDTPGSNSRGAKRIVFSNDGLVYYTEDHYESFELLYGEP